MRRPPSLTPLSHHRWMSLQYNHHKCKYLTWTLNRVKIKRQAPTKNMHRGNNKHTGHNNQNSQNVYMVVPYYKGLSESIKRSCRKYWVDVHFKGGLTIKNLIMATKDKDPILKKSGVIYRYKCDRAECDEEYIGESARIFAERFKEYQKAPAPIYNHYNTSGHSITTHNFLTLSGGKTRTTWGQSMEPYT